MIEKNHAISAKFRFNWKKRLRMAKLMLNLNLKYRTVVKKRFFRSKWKKKLYEKDWPWMTRYDLADSWVLVKLVCCDVLSKIAVRKSINVMRISSLFFFSKQWQDKKLSWDSRLNSGTSSQTLRFLKIDRLNHILQSETKNLRCTGSFCLKYDKGTMYL